MKKLVLTTFGTFGLLTSTIFANSTQSNIVYSVQIASFLKTDEQNATNFYNNIHEQFKNDCVLYPIKRHLAVRCFTENNEIDLNDKLKLFRNNGIKTIVYKTKYDKFRDLLNKNKSKKDETQSDDYFDEEDDSSDNANGKLKKEEAIKKISQGISKVLAKEVNTQRENAHLNFKHNLNSSSKTSYTIQLISIPKSSIEIAKKTFNELPHDIKEKSVLYPLGSYITIRYLSSDGVTPLKSVLKDMKKTQFKDSLIVRMNTNKYIKLLNKNSNYENNTIQHDSDDSQYSLSCTQQQSFKFEKLDNFQYTRILSNAHKFKSLNKVRDSIKQYERAFAHQQSNNAINNNLFYLYGKTNNWPKASEKLCLLKKHDKVLYSYAIGALEINNPMIEDELKDTLHYDKSGYIHLALGVYFERNEMYIKAHSYFKKAYDINRYDVYLAFAYARSCEIESDYKKAAFVYKMISDNREDRLLNLKQQAKQRYEQISRMLEQEDER